MISSFIKDSSVSLREAMQLDSPPWGEVTYKKDTVRYDWTPLEDYPVVGVSYQQAQAFCKWRTDAVNLLFLNADYANGTTAKLYRKLKPKYDIEFCWRLPTLEEWNYALATDLVGNTYGIDTVSKRWFPFRFELREVQEMLKKEKSKKRSLRQIKRDVAKYYKANPYYNRINYLLTAPPPYFDRQYVKSKLYPHSYSYPSLILRYSHFSHGRGFYNLVGNAAEIVTSGDSVFVIGGSFAHTLDELKPPNKAVYTKPEAYIGFRCVAEMRIKVKK